MAELMGNPVTSPSPEYLLLPGAVERAGMKTPKSYRDMEGKMSQLILFFLLPQTEQVGGVYQCGRFAKGEVRELKVQSVLGRRQGLG